MTSPTGEAIDGHPSLRDRPATARPSTSRLTTMALVLATTAGATFTILIAGGAGPQALPVRVVYDVMAAVALVPWLIVATVRPSWRPSSVLLPAIGVCLAVFAISTVTSRVPRLSLELFAYAILLTGVYLLLITLIRRPETRAHLERLALLLCLVVCGLYLAQVLQSWTEWWGLVGRIAVPPLRPEYLGLTLGSPNPVAAIVLMLGALGLATSPFRGRAGRVAAALVVVLIAVTTLVTASRGAWLGAAAGVVAAGVAAVLVRSDTRGRAWRFVHTRAGVGVAVAVLIMAVGVVGLAALTGRLTLDDSGYREGFVAVSAKLFSSAPLTGVGPGAWAVLRAAATNPRDPDLYVPHPHNLYLFTATEFGVLGVVAGIVLVGALGLLVVRAIRSEDPRRRRVAYAAVFAIFVFAGQQVGDVLVNVLAVLLAVALPVAWLDAVAQPPPVGTASADPRLERFARASMLGAAALLIVILVGIARVESATAAAQDGVDLANAGQWSDASSRFGDAVAIDPEVPLYQFSLGVAAADAGDLALAERALAASANADDYTYAWLDLAAVRWRLGDDAGARDALVRAERLGLQRPPVAVAAGWLHQQLGDEQAAVHDYTDAISLAPGLLGDPFWSAPSGLPAGLADALTSVERNAAPDTALQVALMQGHYEDARATLGRFPSSERAAYADAIAAWQGDAEAWRDLQAETAAQPLDPTRIGLARLVAVHLGDAAAITRYHRWLEIVQASENALPIVGRVVFGQPQPIPPYLIDRYGSLYRRDIFVAQVVSLLPQIVWQDHE